MTRFTVVSFHAHPDDEALLTGGTLARAAAEGHRVVLVVATAGEAGLAGRRPPESLGAVRRSELAASAAALGVSRVVELGYPDSGGRPGHGFAGLPVEQATDRLARVLDEEAAHVLTSYDANGGYGHPDHLMVHRVGAAAAAVAGTPVVVEASLDRTLFRRAGRLVGAAARVLPVPTMPDPESAYLPPEQLTHRVDVGPHWAAKRAALAAHATQREGGGRTLAWLQRVPLPVLRRVWRYEWFREPGRGQGRCDDIFASLR